MLRIASDDMPLEAPDLVRAAMVATSSATPTDLARNLKMSSYSAPRNVKRWLDGETQPDYESTLLLIGAAGLLHPESGEPRASRLAETTLADVVSEIAALDRKIDVTLAQRLESLEAAVRDLARQVTGAPR